MKKVKAIIRLALVTLVILSCSSPQSKKKEAIKILEDELTAIAYGIFA